MLIKKIETYCAENTIDVEKIDSSTRLMGSGGLFDSLDLVNFIVEVEEVLQDDFDIEVTLTDERAMSRRTSPFINAETLANFIVEHIDEK